MHNSDQSQKASETPRPPSEDPGSTPRDSEGTRYDKMISRLKNRPWIALVLVIGVVVISVGSLTDALSGIRTFLRGFNNSSRGRFPVALLVGNVDASTAEFSVLNSTTDQHFELTSIYALQLKQVDLCRSCLFEGRQQLELDLRRLASNTELASGRLGPGKTRLFGKVGTYHLAPGETAPFALHIKNRVIGYGSVFVLDVPLNAVEQARAIDWLPPYVFYVGGPPDFRSQFIKVFTFDNWVNDPSELIRGDIADALAELNDERLLPALRRAAMDHDDHVRAAAKRAIQSIQR